MWRERVARSDSQWGRRQLQTLPLNPTAPPKLWAAHINNIVIVMVFAIHKIEVV